MQGELDFCMDKGPGVVFEGSPGRGVGGECDRFIWCDFGPEVYEVFVGGGEGLFEGAVGLGARWRELGYHRRGSWGWHLRPQSFGSREP